MNNINNINTFLVSLKNLPKKYYEFMTIEYINHINEKKTIKKYYYKL